MATQGDKDYIKRPERADDPAEQDGGDVNEAADLSTAQTAGSRNVRANEYDGVKHNTEPYGSTQSAGAEQNDTGHAVGITSKKLSEEIGAAKHVETHQHRGNEGAFADNVREASTDDSKLPRKMAEKVETVNVSTGTVNK